MTTFVAKCAVEGGALTVALPTSDIADIVRMDVARAADKFSGFLRVSLQMPRKKRTNDQNAKYWAIVAEIASEVGDDAESVSDDIKKRAIKRGYPYTVSHITGEIKPVSSTRVDTAQFSALIETAQEVAAFVGIVTE